MAPRYWLLLTVAVHAIALAGQAQPPTSPTPPSSMPEAPGQRQGLPDEDFIEFLGADDVGDAAWWEFLKNAAPPGSQPPAPPPQDAKP